MCLVRAFVLTSMVLMPSRYFPQVQAKLSGTTATMATIHGNLLTVANVGDSRVILGHRVHGDHHHHPNLSTMESSSSTREEAKVPIEDEIVDPHNSHVLAIPLSRDQTPYRKDERDRIKRMGGSVMTIGQMEGKHPVHSKHDNDKSNDNNFDYDDLEFGDMVLGQDVDIGGDKPRVWLPGQKYPGCAFTRSLGDAAAEAVGVTAEPELLSRQLTENDEILILASDGIFEFLTNQEVLDMSRSCGTPLRACECLVEAAYNLWMKYEPRSDDITVIVCYLKCSKPVPDEGWDETTEGLVDVADSFYGTKPVRRPLGENDMISCVPAPGTSCCAPVPVAKGQ